MLLVIDGDSIPWKVCSPKRDFIQTIEAAELYLEKIFSFTGCSKYRMFLGGGRTFRNDLAPTYKAQRPTARPRYFGAIRDYLVTYWGAEVCDGIEADDACAMLADDDTIICSADKDMLQISCNHLRLGAKGDLELVYVTEEEAWFNFFTQMLMGDTVDNIEGPRNPSKSHHKKPPGFSLGTATAVLVGKTKEEMETLVRDLYLAQYGDLIQYELNWKLLWLLRE